MLPSELLDEILKLCDLDSLAQCALANTAILPIARYHLYHTLIYNDSQKDGLGRKLRGINLRNTSPLLAHTRRLFIFATLPSVVYFTDLFKSLVEHGKLEALTSLLPPALSNILIYSGILGLPSMNRFRAAMIDPHHAFSLPHLKDFRIPYSTLVSDLEFHQIQSTPLLKLDTFRITLRNNPPSDDVHLLRFLDLSTVRRVSFQIWAEVEFLDSLGKVVNGIIDRLPGVTEASFHLDWDETINPMSLLSIFLQIPKFRRLTRLVLAADLSAIHDGNPTHIVWLSTSFITQLVHASAPLKIVKLRIAVYRGHNVSGKETGWYELGQATKTRGVELEVHFSLMDQDRLLRVPQLIEGVDRITIDNFREQPDSASGDEWSLLAGESTDL